MLIAVKADRVALSAHPVEQVGMSGSARRDHKERRTGARLAEHVEQPRRRSRVRAVIECQRERLHRTHLPIRVSFFTREMSTPGRSGAVLGSQMAIAVLDIDGTLVDTNYQHALAWFRAFRHFDVVLPIWRIHRHVGMGGDQLVDALYGERFEDE